MSVLPIKCGTICVPRSCLVNTDVLIGIDAGTSLTKVVFLHKNRRDEFLQESNEYVTLNHALFTVGEFIDAIKWTLEQAYVPNDTTVCVHVTGSEAFHRRDDVSSHLVPMTRYIDEEVATIVGHKIGLQHIGLDRLLRPAIEFESLGKFQSPFLENFTKSVSSKFSQETKSCDGDVSSVFPCLVHVFGSMSKIYYFDEDGKGERISGPLTAGATFLGLGKCLLDTNKYEEIIRLASTGNRCNVDTQVKDIMASDINSPYGKMPGEWPLFAFGKSMDFDIGLDEYAKEDVAISLVSFIGRFMSSYSIHACQIKGIDKIYLTGNIFNSNLFQREIQQSQRIFPFVRNLRVLDFGYATALGAMLCDNSDWNCFRKTPHEIFNIIGKD